MVQRKDGLETRTHLLEAGADMFAEKGYGDALVAEICERAGANVAAVNYHFGGKEALYVEVWRQQLDEAQNLYPLEGDVAPDASLEERLRAHIFVMLQRMTDRGRLGNLHRLFEHERANPTGLIDELLRKLREPGIQVLHGLVREGLGEDVSEETLQFTVFSIINQCRGVIGSSRRGAPPFIKKPLTRPAIERLADHMARFSVGGMEKIRQTSNRKTSQ